MAPGNQTGKTVLMATLGAKNPGAVTSSIDVLVRHQRQELETPDFQLDKLVVLMTPGEPKGPPRCGYQHEPKDEGQLSTKRRQRREYDYIREDLEKNPYYDKNGITIAEREPLVLNICYDDLYTEFEAVDFLRLCLREIKRHQDQGYSVFVAYTGGRKTMSALALMAAVMLGLSEQCFQAVVPEEIGQPPLGAKPGDSNWDEVMHPPNAWYLGSSAPLFEKEAEAVRDAVEQLIEMPPALKRRLLEGQPMPVISECIRRGPLG